MVLAPDFPAIGGEFGARTDGTYRAAFLDPVGGRTLEYFDGSVDFAGATPFNITAATNTTRNAALALP